MPVRSSSAATAWRRVRSRRERRSVDGVAHDGVASRGGPGWGGAPPRGAPRPAPRRARRRRRPASCHQPETVPRPTAARALRRPRARRAAGKSASTRRPTTPRTVPGTASSSARPPPSASSRRASSLRENGCRSVRRRTTAAVAALSEPAGRRRRTSSCPRPRKAIGLCPGKRRGGAVVDHDERPRTPERTGHVVEQRERGGVGPVEVLEHDDVRALRGGRSSARATASNRRGPVLLLQLRPALAGEPRQLRPRACSRSAWRTGRHGANGGLARRRARTARPRRAAGRRRRPRRPGASCRSPPRGDRGDAGAGPAPRRRAARRAGRARPPGRPAARPAHGEGRRDGRRRSSRSRTSAAERDARGRPWRAGRAAGRRAARHAGHAARGGDGLRVEMLRDDGVRVARERRPAADELVQRRARARRGRCAGRRRPPSRLLGRHVERRAGQRAGLARPTRRRPARSRSRRAPRPPSPVEPHVVGLDVAVDDAVRVRVRERGGRARRRPGRRPPPATGDPAPRRAGQSATRRPCSGPRSGARPRRSTTSYTVTTCGWSRAGPSAAPRAARARAPPPAPITRERATGRSSVRSCASQTSFTLPRPSRRCIR